MNKIFKILSYLKATKSLNLLYLISIISSLLEYLFIFLIYSTVNYRVQDEIPVSISKIISFFESYKIINNENLYFLLISILVIVFLLKTFIGLFFNFKLSYISQKIVYLLSNKVLKLSLKDNLVLENKKNSSYYKNTIIVDSPMFGSSVLQPLFFFINDFLIFIAILFFLFLAQPIVSIYISLVVIFVFSILYFLFKGKLIKWGQVREKSSFTSIQKINEIYKGILEIKIYNVENFFYKNILIHLDKLRSVLTKTNFLNHLPRVILETLIFAVLFIILFIEFIEKDTSLLPYISALLAGSIKLIPIFSRIMTSVQNFFFAKSIIKKFYSLLKSNIVSEKKKQNIDFYKSREISFIEINNLSFNFKDDKILKNINLRLNKNFPIGITGESGSGKSTLAKIICGISKNFTGKIKFLDTKKNILYSKPSIGLASIIPQDVFIFDDTLINNLVFSKKKISKKDFGRRYNNLLKNLKINNARKLGEDGKKISGGQRQRLGVLRSLFFDKKIIIFDESTSNLDENNKILLLDLVNFLKKDKIIIIISHDKKFLKICKKIYILKKGNLIAKKA